MRTYMHAYDYFRVYAYVLLVGSIIAFVNNSAQVYANMKENLIRVIGASTRPCVDVPYR